MSRGRDFKLRFLPFATTISLIAHHRRSYWAQDWTYLRNRPSYQRIYGSTKKVALVERKCRIPVLVLTNYMRSSRFYHLNLSCVGASAKPTTAELGLDYKTLAIFFIGTAMCVLTFFSLYLPFAPAGRLHDIAIVRAIRLGTMLHCSITALVLLFLPPSTHFLCTPSVFTKISFALAPSASSALALFINPSSVTSTEMTIITWNNAFSDPLFTIEINYPSFNNVLAVANNINPANDNITVTIPPLHYTLTSSISPTFDVLATSSDFHIAAGPDSASAFATAMGASGAGTGAGASVTGTGACGSGTAISSGA
ncbi:hypothetical protein B0H11DRAFT_2223651 [Mycena galericulata]|nr:hypothetical protein B0H11DRAFT_2223651 [Mycena galericulata]